MNASSRRARAQPQIPHPPRPFPPNTTVCGEPRQRARDDDDTVPCANRRRRTARSSHHRHNDNTHATRQCSAAHKLSNKAKHTYILVRDLARVFIVLFAKKIQICRNLVCINFLISQCADAIAFPRNKTKPGWS